MDRDANYWFYQLAANAGALKEQGYGGFNGSRGGSPITWLLVPGFLCEMVRFQNYPVQFICPVFMTSRREARIFIKQRKVVLTRIIFTWGRLSH